MLVQRGCPFGLVEFSSLKFTVIAANQLSELLGTIKAKIYLINTEMLCVYY
jgi:hypothetical protein